MSLHPARASEARLSGGALQLAGPRLAHARFPTPTVPPLLLPGWAWWAVQTVHWTQQAATVLHVSPRGCWSLQPCSQKSLCPLSFPLCHVLPRQCICLQGAFQRRSGGKACNTWLGQNQTFNAVEEYAPLKEASWFRKDTNMGQRTLQFECQFHHLLAEPHFEPQFAPGRTGIIIVPPSWASAN